MKVLIASGNPHKFKEYQLLLAGASLELVRPPREVKAAENGGSFKANALIKAHAYGQNSVC